MYLFFDTETTGLPKSWKADIGDFENWPRLVQLAYITFDEDGIQTSTQSFIINPVGFMIPPDATMIHGISNEFALENGKDLIEVLDHFEECIKEAEVLVAHNISFDESIIGSEFIRIGKPNPLANKRKICTMDSSKEFCGIINEHGYKWPKLTELHQKLFNQPFEGLHNASIDIGITAKCFWELRRLNIL